MDVTPSIIVRQHPARPAPRRPRVAVLRAATSLETNRTGGGRYQAMAVDALRRTCDVSVHYVYYEQPTADALPRRARRFARMAWTLRTQAFDADVLLLDRRTMFLHRKRPDQVAVGLYHHHDVERGGGLGRLLVDVSARVGLRRVDVLVAVSRYWQERFREMGARDVRVVYNPFERRTFEVAELAAFRARHGLDIGAPVVYLGMDAPEKGAADVYERLKGRGYVLVTSGPRRTALPTRHLDLPYDDYLKLLAVSDVAVLMSRLPEGWCRAAHEAMLMGTPVIGSGRAGMAELLEGGGQLVCKDLGALAGRVAALLADAGLRAAVGRRGQTFAEGFTVERFERAWQDLVAGLCRERGLAGGGAS